MPKSKKGRLTVPVHPICHKMIHKVFTNAQLAQFGYDREALIANAKLAKFLSWIEAKPPDFNAPVRR